MLKSPVVVNMLRFEHYVGERINHLCDRVHTKLEEED
jgi:hypothetical protein